MMEKRMKIIAEIRAIFKAPKNFSKTFDPTFTMGYGLLEEMSLKELQTRLTDLKFKRESER